jgi:hypothetical protein
MAQRSLALERVKTLGKNPVFDTLVCTTSDYIHMEHIESDFIFLRTSPRGYTKVSKENYSLITGVILSVLEQKPRLTIIELIELISERLKDFKGNLPWYVLHIKADLESRRIINCQTGIGPERNQFIQKCRINKFNRFEMKWLLKFRSDLRHM